MIGGFFFLYSSPPSSFHAVSCAISKSGHVESGFSRLLLDNVARFALCNEEPTATLNELVFSQGLASWVIQISLKCGNFCFITQILFGLICFLFFFFLFFFFSLFLRLSIPPCVLSAAAFTGCTAGSVQGWESALGLYAIAVLTSSALQKSMGLERSVNAIIGGVICAYVPVCAFAHVCW